MKHTILTKVLLALSLATASFGVNADYPARAINIIVPYKTGGGTDAYARALSAAAMAMDYDAPLVIANKAGSGGLNGARSVFGARPDGYTLMLTSGGSFLLSTLLRDTPIDALESFEFVAQVGQLKTSMVVPAASPFQSVQDVVDAAKQSESEGTQLRWGHSGRGGFHYVGGLGFMDKNGFSAKDVPFKGGGPARAAVIGGQVDFAFLGVQQLRGFESQMRALAVNSATRDSVMKEVPSFGELGFDFADVSSPVIVFAPKGTPPEVINKLRALLIRLTAHPKFAESLAKRGTGPVFASGEDAKKTLAAMKADVAPLVADIKQ